MDKGLEDVKDALDGELEARSQQVEDAAKIIDNDESIVLQRPVGTGKTEVAIQGMLGNALNQEDGERYRALVLAPSKSIAEQWERRLEEYGLADDEFFDVMRNQSKKNFSQHSNIRSVPDQLGSRKSQMIQVEDKEFKKHKDKVYGRDNVPFSESDRIWGPHNVDTSGADIVISTYHLLDSDIENGRVEIGDVGFDDIIIDEATVSVARQEHQDLDEGETFFGGYQPAEQFKDLLNQTMGDSNYIALTALPGRKLDAIKDYLGASLIRPDETDLSESMANVTERHHRYGEDTFEENVFEKEVGVVNKRIGQIENTLSNFRSELKGKVKRARGGETEIGDQISPYAHTDSDNPEIRRSAIKALSYDHKSQMLHEGGAKLLDDEFDSSLPSDYVDPKVDGLETLADSWEDKDENFVVFTSHKETAEYLNKSVAGSTATVTGNNSDSHNEDVLQGFGDEYNGLFMTYGYGSEGIDLPEGDHIVHMSDEIDPELKQSATGRAKRGESITEHTLLYDFENAQTYNSDAFVEEDNLDSTPETRSQLRYMLDGDSSWEDINREEQLEENRREYDHLLNTTPKEKS